MAGHPASKRTHDLYTSNC